MQKNMIKRMRAYQDTNQELASHWHMEQVQNMEHARMKRKENICNVMTQDMPSSFGNKGEK